MLTSRNPIPSASADATPGLYGELNLAFFSSTTGPPPDIQDLGRFAAMDQRLRPDVNQSGAGIERPQISASPVDSPGS